LAILQMPVAAINIFTDQGLCIFIAINARVQQAQKANGVVRDVERGS